MKKLMTLVTLGAVSAFAHEHNHIDDSILEMIVHPFTGIDHILGIVALAGVTYYAVKKIKAVKEKNK